MVKAQIDSAIQELTGLLPQSDGTMVPAQDQGKDADGNPIPPSGGPAPVSLKGVDVQELDGAGSVQAMQNLVTQAYGTKLGSRQIPTDDDN